MNVEVIGKRAFHNCKMLKNISITSTNLKIVGNSCFKGISIKARIRVPEAKQKIYTKILSKKGQRKTVKITK